jgi:anti-sigma factor RsiW
MAHLDEHKLNEYLDGMLATAEIQVVETHLETCIACRQSLADLQTLFLALDEVRDVAYTADLSSKVLAELNPTEEKATWLQPLLFVQVVAVFGMLIWLWPTFQSWLGQGESALRLLLAGFEPIRVNVWEQALSWGTAVWQQIQLASPTINLAAGQWAWLIGLALIAWLAGNRLLFTNDQLTMNNEH